MITTLIPLIKKESEFTQYIQPFIVMNSIITTYFNIPNEQVILYEDWSYDANDNDRIGKLYAIITKKNTKPFIMNRYKQMSSIVDDTTSPQVEIDGQLLYTKGIMTVETKIEDSFGIDFISIGFNATQEALYKSQINNFFMSLYNGDVYKNFLENEMFVASRDNLINTSAVENYSSSLVSKVLRYSLGFNLLYNNVHKESVDLISTATLIQKIVI